MSGQLRAASRAVNSADRRKERKRVGRQEESTKCLAFGPTSIARNGTQWKHSSGAIN
jgi:hypothetical protein